METKRYRTLCGGLPGGEGSTRLGQSMCAQGRYPLGWLVGALVGTCLVAGESMRQWPAFGSDRYANAMFVCRSVDPSGSALNFRQKPAGRILCTLSPQSVLYVRGRDLQNPVRGYVPIRFYLELAAADPRKGAENSVSSAPAGWVWKSYLTCELSS